MTMRYLWPYLVYLMRHPVMSLSPEERNIVRGDYQMLRVRLDQTQKVLSQELIQAILQVFYLDVCRMLELRVPREDQYNARTYNLFYHFMQILAAHYTTQREVAWDASQLSWTPKYMSEVVKNVTGRTVGQWISLMVVMEIKSLLRNTDMSIKQIAQRLNFSTQSFLGRYFKNNTGISPLDYRKRFSN